MTIENKPTIYNAPSVYKLGGAGGASNVVKVDGIEYEFVRIGNRYYTTENLKNLFPGSLQLNGAFSGASCRWFNNNEAQATANKYNLAYTINSLDVIDSLLSDGWRVNTYSDIMYLRGFGSGQKFCAWKSNDCGLSFVQNGNGDTDGNFWYNMGNSGGIRTKERLVGIDDSGSILTGDVVDRWAAVRLVKDVT